MEKIEEWVNDNNLNYDFGYGNGSISGEGSGSGSGDGYGSGLGQINNRKVYTIDDTPTIIEHIRGNVAKGFILQDDFQLKPCYIVKGNGYFAHGETLKEAQKDLESKIFEDMDIDERIDNFLKEFELNKKYPASKFYEWHNKLTGSCKMGRDNFIESHGINLKSKYTVQEFIELTKNSYGGDVIRELEERIMEV